MAPDDSVPTEQQEVRALETESEDLFDFPAAEDTGARSQPQPALPSSSPESVTAGELLRIDPTPQPADAAAPAPAASSGDDLDEDLFDFGELFTANEGAAGDDAFVQVEAITNPAHSPSRPQPEAPAQPAPEAPTEEATEVVPAARVPREPSEARTAADSLVEAARGAAAAHRRILAATTSEPNPFRSRLVVLLAAAFLIVNSTLILVAWKTSTALGSAIDGVRTDLSRSLTDLRAPAPANATDVASRPTPGPTVPEPRPEPSQVAVQMTSPLEGFEQQELRVAVEELEAGSYSAARLRLHRLLANRDRMPLSAESVAEAEYRIAKSYFVQARSVEEVVR